GLLALILAPECYLPLRELGTAHHASDDGRAARETTNAVLNAPSQHPVTAAENGAPLADVVVTGLSVTYAGMSQAAVGPLTFT
ncbi:hypothetical protein SB764_43400, partial [Paraburkholderia sp. SIMBA_027]